MAANYDELENEARALPSREKAKLARTLIDELDSDVDENAEELWLEEAKVRLQAYREGRLESASGEEAMQRARNRLK